MTPLSLSFEFATSTLRITSATHGTITLPDKTTADGTELQTETLITTTSATKKINRELPGGSAAELVEVEERAMEVEECVMKVLNVGKSDATVVTDFNKITADVLIDAGDTEAKQPPETKQHAPSDTTDPSSNLKKMGTKQHWEHTNQTKSRTGKFNHCCSLLWFTFP